MQDTDLFQMGSWPAFRTDQFQFGAAFFSELGVPLLSDQHDSSSHVLSVYGILD